MSLLTSLISGTGGIAGGTLPASRFGLWRMALNYPVPNGVAVGTTNNRFTFDTLIDGTFPDFNTTTHLLTVTTKGWYNLSWAGTINTADTFGGTHRMPMIKLISTTARNLEIGNASAISTASFGGTNYQISESTVLKIGDVVEFGFEYDGSAGLIFDNLTTLSISLLHTL